jgi:hypothetical protein
MNAYDGHSPEALLEFLEFWGSLEEREKREEAAEEEDRQRVEAVRIPGDHPLEGLTAKARAIGWSKQRLAYALPRFPELAFVREPTMCSSLTNPDLRQAIETRIANDQRERGRAMGKANEQLEV